MEQSDEAEDTEQAENKVESEDCDGREEQEESDDGVETSEDGGEGALEGGNAESSSDESSIEITCGTLEEGGGASASPWDSSRFLLSSCN